MDVLRTARRDELEEILAFDREYAGSDVSPAAFERWFEARPDLFVVGREDGELVAEAYGRVGRPEEDPTGSGGDRVVLQSIAVRPDRRGEGLGRTVLDRFEAQATNHGERVSAAAAANVEGFYRSCGYEPTTVLLQVDEAELPADYDEVDGFLGERTPEPGIRFLYVGLDEYEPERRRELLRRVDAFEANTIYEKQGECLGA